MTRRSLRLLPFLIAALFLLPSAAQAGSWHLLSCGSTPAGVQSYDDNWLGSGAGEGNSFANVPSPGCISPGYMVAQLDGGAAQDFGDAETLQFNAPDGSVIGGGKITLQTRTSESPSGTEDPVVVVGTDQGAFYECGGQFGGGPPSCDNGSAWNLGIPAGNSYQALTFTAVCSGAGSDGGQCNADGSGPVAFVKVLGTDLIMSTNVVPSINEMGGGVVGGPVTGMSDLLVSSGEIAGPGIYSVKVTADGSSTPLYNGPADSGNPQCVNVGAQVKPTAEAYAFANVQPCDLNASTDVSINTALLTDGTHTLTVTATDASGTVSAPQSVSIITSNDPIPGATPTIEDITNPNTFLTGDTLLVDDTPYSVPPGAGNLGLTYQWVACPRVNAAGAGLGCQAIPGANGSQYAPPQSLANQFLYVSETASDNDGSLNFVSPLTPALTAGPVTPIPHLCLRSPSTKITRTLSRSRHLTLTVRTSRKIASSTKVQLSISGKASKVFYQIGSVKLGYGKGRGFAFVARGADLGATGKSLVTVKVTRGKRTSTYRTRLPMTHC